MLSVILPTRNEPLINELIQEVNLALKDYKHEIIIVDKSDVKPEIKDAELIIQKSKGLGNAVLEGVANSNGEHILVMDADFSHDPKDIVKLLEKKNEYDIVMGRRYGKDARSDDKLFNRIYSRFTCNVTSLVLGLNMIDPLNGFALIKREIYDKIKLNPLGYKIHMETIYKAKKLGYKIVEVPTKFSKRRAGKSSRDWKEGFRGLLYMFQLRLGIR